SRLMCAAAGVANAQAQSNEVTDVARATEEERMAANPSGAAPFAQTSRERSRLFAKDSRVTNSSGRFFSRCLPTPSMKHVRRMASSAIEHVDARHGELLLARAGRLRILSRAAGEYVYGSSRQSVVLTSSDRRVAASSNVFCALRASSHPMSWRSMCSTR